MKKYILILLLLALLASTNTSYASALDIPQDVLTAAEDGLQLVQEELCKDPNSWGFANGDTVERLALGTGYHVKFVSKDYLAQTIENSIDEIVDPDIIDTWEFTLDIDGVPEIFLSIAYEEGMYQVVHYGGDATAFGTAKEYLTELAAEHHLSVQDELLKVGNEYYFMARGENEFIFPATNTRLRSAELVTASELIETLQNAQNATYNKERGGNAVNDSSFDINFTFVAAAFAALLFASLALLITSKRKTQV